MKETRFERSENRVRVRQNLVNHLETLSFLFFACLRCNEDKIWAMHYRSLTTAWFSAFSRVFTAMKTKSGQYTIEVILQRVFLAFCCVFPAMKTKYVQKNLRSDDLSVKCPKFKKSYGQILHSTIRTLVQKSFGTKRSKRQKT